MKIIDLTHSFGPNMPSYPGDEKSVLELVNPDDEECNDYRVQMGMHTGTHIDAPLHMLKMGKKISDYPVEHFFGDGHLIDARGRETIDVDLLNNHSIKKGDIVFILTGFSKQFREPSYYEDYPEITPAFTAKLIEIGVKIVGMDTPSPDRPPFDVHKMLFKNDMLIVENLTNLEALLETPTFHAIVLPTKFEAEAAPVRVVAQI